MPRPTRKKIELTQESLLDQLNELNNQIERMRQNAEKDYSQVTGLGTDVDTVAQLAMAKGNAMKYSLEYYKLRVDVIKIMKGTMADMNKQVDPEADSNNMDMDEDWKLMVQNAAKAERDKEKE